ncbi:MAG TPA: hypothetical protein VIU61_11185 [Kofleriaceae bacterium]
MRGLATLVVLALTIWLGSLLGACLFKPCKCPPARTITPGKWTVTRSPERPELMGAVVEAQPGKVVLRYSVDGSPREVVFAATEQ